MVVAYDVANDRRRMRLHALLLRHGDPVQESVFECDLDPKQLRALRQQVRRIIRPEDDRVRIYSLCRDCVARIENEAGAVAPVSPVRIV